MKEVREIWRGSTHWWSEWVKTTIPYTHHFPAFRTLTMHGHDKELPHICSTIIDAPYSQHHIALSSNFATFYPQSLLRKFCFLSQLIPSRDFCVDGKSHRCAFSISSISVHPFVLRTLRPFSNQVFLKQQKDWKDLFFGNCMLISSASGILKTVLPEGRSTRFQ